MSYRRDYQMDEQTHLPLETTYNSVIDGDVDKVYTNRIHFKYPPEWHTSNVNEKIIGIRNIYIKRKCRTLRFFLYVRKYRKAAFDDKKDDGYVEYMIQLMYDITNNLHEVFWIYLKRADNTELKSTINGKIYYHLNSNQRLDIMITTLDYDETMKIMLYALSTKECDYILDRINNSEGFEKRIELQLTNMKPTDISVFRIL